jgi:dipeptidase E
MISMKSPRLVLYSGGQERGNADLHQRLVSMAAPSSAKKSSRLTMTYVPFCTEGSQEYFHRAIRRYAPYGVVDFLCLDLEQNPTLAEIREALRSDIVYLAGGNTFFFLYHLKRLGVLPLLRNYVRRGGVLAGLSAGALIMTPSIQMAGVPGLEPDENEIGLKDLSGLAVVPFEFSPHFEPTKARIQRHIAYSEKTSRPIYASLDGGGVVVEGRGISLIGPTWLFFRGTGVRIN